MDELLPTEDAQGPYRVLARKYRPTTFAELIGQDALVRTLTNAIRTGRIAHAFVLTGVRGIGKTTTARLIARALNCVGPDGKGGPTITPCGECEHCTAIAQDRHVDVMEMDAASRTGVDDIRDLIEGAQYRPVRARYKVYIIDEVHMLSKPAFNALLKTLEEPPEHVKFVFATTEIRKVPITVLSRCQRFDLRRVERGQLAAHLAGIAEKEAARLAPDAVALLARAADGSVRDGLSLLDRAIAEAEPGQEIPAAQVRAMLGLADRNRTLDLFEAVMKGAIAEALDIAGEMYRDGADPLTLVQDLLESTHDITRLKLAAAQAATDLGAGDLARLGPMAERLSVPVLSRAWQMLLKGVNEVQFAPQPASALEMLLVRLAYASDLPTPGEIVARFQGEGGASPPASGGAPPGKGTPSGGAQGNAVGGSTIGGSGIGGSGIGGSGTPGGLVRGGTRTVASAHRPEAITGGARTALARQPAADPAPPLAPRAAPRPAPTSFPEIVALFDERREAMLLAHLRRDVHLVRCESGRLEFRPGPHAPPHLPSRIGELLTAWTGQRWVVSISNEPGQPTLHEQAEARKADAHAKALEHPIVKRALAVFPGADVKVQPVDAPAPEPADDAPADDAPDEAVSPDLTLDDYPADYGGPDEEDFA
jgi:DNA polymerase-3 subunit gamma/tau